MQAFDQASVTSDPQGASLNTLLVPGWPARIKFAEHHHNLQPAPA